MISSLSTTLSALGAFGQKMGVTAHNTANVDTQGFKKSRVTLTEDLNGGVRAETVQPNAPGYSDMPEAVNGRPDKEPSDVDMAEEITQAALTKRFYQANLKMVETQDEMLATVLDILA